MTSRKHIFCLVLVLGDAFWSSSGNAGIIYAKATEEGKQFVLEHLDHRDLAFLGLARVQDLNVADPYPDYGVGLTNLASGKLLSAAVSRGAWVCLLLAGTNAVGAEQLTADGKNKALKFNGLYQTDFSNETLEALRIAAGWPQIKKSDYEIRRLDIPGISFVAIWLHGKSDDIIIPLPPTYDRMIAYQPYSESQIIRILAPEAGRSLAMWAKLDEQRNFGDTTPLRTALSELNDTFPELSAAGFSTNSPFYADNAVVANYFYSSDNELTIVAKAYDSNTAAAAGQERDQREIQAGGWNKKTIIQGVHIYENTDYGTMYFQTGHYTFKLMVSRFSRENVPPLLLKVGAVLITAFAPPVKQP
jgi:hypothetical protein